jgi:hypothetical protein
MEAKMPFTLEKAKFVILLLKEFLNDYLLQCGYVYFKNNQDVFDISNNMKCANYDLPEDKFLFLFTYFNQLYKMY